jgi:hypothetical protein
VRPEFFLFVGLRESLPDGFSSSRKMKLSFGFLFLFHTHTILKQNIANLFCAKIYIIKSTFFTFLFLFHPSYPIFFSNIPVNQIIKQEAPRSLNRLPDFDL